MGNVSEWFLTGDSLSSKLDNLYDHIMQNSDINGVVLFASPKLCTLLENNRYFKWERDESGIDIHLIIIDGIEYLVRTVGKLGKFTLYGLSESEYEEIQIKESLEGEIKHTIKFPDFDFGLFLSGSNSN